MSCCPCPLPQDVRGLDPQTRYPGYELTNPGLEALQTAEVEDVEFRKMVALGGSLSPRSQRAMVSRLDAVDNDDSKRVERESVEVLYQWLLRSWTAQISKSTPWGHCHRRLTEWLWYESSAARRTTHRIY
jgi:hypothetical protein